MKRKLINDLLKWKDLPKEIRKPLLLDGARQVGKTYLLEHELGSHFENVVRVNFQNLRPELKEVFAGTIDPQRIISTIEIYLKTKIDPDKTLLIFDEVQEVPRALTSLKYFCEDAPEYHIAAAGSLLGVFLSHRAESPFPVGKVDRYKLEPMSFEEFLWAAGRAELAQHLKETPTSEVFDEILTDLFREYLAVGGMPEAVQTWISTRDLNLVSHVHKNILSDYRDDFVKYTDSITAVRTRQIFESLPSQFAKRNEKFLYNVVKTGARAREYELAVDWLVNSGIVRKVSRVSGGERAPLAAYEDISSFKLYFVDVALFKELSGIENASIFGDEKIFSEFGGLMAEQFVLQQLSPTRLYYWAQDTSEVDFVMQKDMNIMPIEVKSGKNVQAKSLKVFREKYQPRLSLRFSLLPVKQDSATDGTALLNIPLYKIFLLDELIKTQK